MAPKKFESRPPILGCDPHVKFSKNAGKVGLKNLTNTCFMNAGLQCLSHIEPLVAYFLNGQYEKEINATNPLGCKGELARGFAKLQRELWQSDNGIHDPRLFHRTLSKFAPHLFEGAEQQDVQEFLAFCLDGLHEDLNRVRVRPPPSTEERLKQDEALVQKRNDEFAAALAWLRHLERGKSFLVDLLQGQLRSSLTCSTCGYKSTQFDPFLYLSLPVIKTMSSVTDAIDKYLEEEILVGDEQWHCPRCSTKVDARKKIDLWKLPPVLVLHLKRFAFDKRSQRFEKVDARLSMKLSLLDLTEYCSSPQRDGAVYDVICVANHCGAYGSGHYTASCRVGGLATGTWNHFDDSRTTPLGGRSVVTRETYVLFLVRRDIPPDKPTWLGAVAGRVLLRRQSLSLPDDWPHPGDQVSAVLSATGSTPAAASNLGDVPTISAVPLVTESVPASSSTSISHDKIVVSVKEYASCPAGNVDAGSRDGSKVVQDLPLPKRQKTLADFFVPRKLAEVPTG